MSADDSGRDDDGASFAVLRGADHLLETDAADVFVAFIPAATRAGT
ncbi:MAG TPA: hypothetical protein VH459_03245 [Gaiellales bacterium]